MFRGFDTHLISRVSRAKGDHHYFDTGTLRWFNAYGGKSFGLPVSRDPDTRFTALVESVEHPSEGRIYRVVTVLFSTDTDGRETVEIFRPEDDAFYRTGATAGRYAERYLRNVHYIAASNGSVPDPLAYAAHNASTGPENRPYRIV